MQRITHFVDGRSTALDSTRTAAVYNPSTGEQSAEVLLASADDTRAAIASAEKAFPA